MADTELAPNAPPPVAPIMGVAQHAVSAQCGEEELTRILRSNDTVINNILWISSL